MSVPNLPWWPKKMLASIFRHRLHTSYIGAVNHAIMCSFLRSQIMKNLHDISLFFQNRCEENMLQRHFPRKHDHTYPSVLFPHLLLGQSTMLRNKQTAVNVQVLPFSMCWTLTSFFLTNWEHKRGHVKYLEFPRDGTNTRQCKEAPNSVHTCEQSTKAGWDDRVGSVGGQDRSVVLQNHIDWVFHCSLHHI